VSIDHLQEALAATALPLCPDPIFIIGSPRSGTTALARALGTHPALWTSHESYLIHSLFGNGVVDRTWRRNVERQQAPSWLKTEQVDRDELSGFLGLGVNALFTSRSGGRRWIDQTPLYTTMVDELAVLFPGAVFLHIVRDGRSVVHSMQHFMQKLEARPQARRYVPAWASDFAEACRTWREWTETAARFCAANPTRAVTVRNEDASRDPSATFSALYDFLGVAWSAAPIEHFARQRVNTSFVGAGAGRPTPVGPERVASWDAGRRATFLDEAGATMVRLGLVTDEELRRWASEGG
jgi:hypothetical protein